MRDPTVSERVRLLSAPRQPVAGLTWVRPRIMAWVNLVNARGESGERSTKGAVLRGRMQAMAGADIIAITASGGDLGDIEEIDRVAPVVEQLAEQGFRVAVASLRPTVIRAAALAGARLVIDASVSIDDDTLYTLGDIALPIILKRTGPIGVKPASWTEALDLAAHVHAALESRIEVFEGAGIRRDSLIIDPGIDGDQPAEENVALLHALSQFHGLGCPLCVSCEAFAAASGGERNGGALYPKPPEVALAALSQGAQILSTSEPEAIWSAAAGYFALAAASFDDVR